MAQALSSSSPPAPAAAVGYNVETFSPSITMGENWYKANFFGINPNAVSATQNANGSVTIDGGGDSYNAQLSTAEQTSTGWQGTAFGGGAYFQATISWTGAYSGSGGWPSFWSNDIEHMIGSSAAQWQGQASGYGNWIEPDFMEYWAQNRYGVALHNWYGANGSGLNVSTNEPQFTLPSGSDPSQPQTYGFLWVPASSTTQGYAEWFFDGQQVGQTVHWNQYNPSAPPPPVSGSSAYSVLDARHLALILGTGPNNPMTVSNVQVWQASAAHDLFQGVPAPTPTPTPAPTPTPTPAPTPTPTSTLTLRVSEDAYNGDAQFIATVDGTQLGGIQTASALHSSGDANIFTFAGNWSASATHQVQIQFVNDAYGGSPALDRNLYVNSIAFNGVTEAATAASLFSNETSNFTVGGTTAAAVSPADTLTLHLAEDAWEGNAQFTLAIDGKTVTTPQAVTALHSAGAWEDLSFAGTFGAGSHTIGVSFTNDAYGGTPATDRNLYINGIDVNGQHYGSGVTTMLSNGTQNFTVTTSH